MQEQKIKTEFGTLWTACSESPNPAILFLHGSASSSRIFDPLLNSPELKDNYNLVVFDFPGHGRSDDAPDPDKSYFQQAYAAAALEVLQYWNVKKVVVLGWSLGGHVALELVTMLAEAKKPIDLQIAGIMVTGTPPVKKQEIKGFRTDAQADVSALFNPDASDEQLEKTASAFTKSTPPAWMIADALRANRSAGKTMATKFMEGHCSDQIKIVHDFQGPGWVAVVNGGAEPLLNLDYCDTVCEGAPRLWRGKCIRFKDGGHAPFYDDPEGFLAVFSSFVDDCKL